ncbi:uncharacterized protein HaLaN_25506, partial [Haematococcus lacustris]
MEHHKIGTERIVFVDERAVAASHSFPLSPDDLIARAKRVLAAGVHKSDELDEGSFEFSVLLAAASRPEGTHLGPFKGKLPFEIPPSKKRVRGPPQTSSLTFNEQGKVVGHTMGYVMDR